MYYKRLLGILIVLTMVILTIAGCQASDEPDLVSEDVSDAPSDETVDEPGEDQGSAIPSQVQYCALFATSIVDNGWDSSGYNSFLRFADNPGEDIEVLELKFIEGLWGDESEGALRAYAEDGCDIIWDHGGYSDIILNVKDDYPEVMFVSAGSGVTSVEGNYYHYIPRCNDGSYLMGVLAGLMGEGTAIGAAGGFPAEDVNGDMNGFFAGAISIKPELEQKVGFINSWYDPVAAGEIAEAQKAQGADMLYMLAENFDVCGPDTGAMCFGSYIDFSEFFPGKVMASFLTTWDPAFEWALQEWLEAKTTGVWSGEPYGFSNNMATGGCEIVLGSGIEETIPADALAKYYATYESIMSGELVPELDISEPVSE